MTNPGPGGGVTVGWLAATTTATDQATTPGDPLGVAEAEPGLSIEVAEATIQRVFGVGMALAACANRVDQRTASRLEHAIEELDQVIRDLRTDIFDRLRPGPMTAIGESQLPKGAAKAIAADLQQLAADVKDLSGCDRAGAHLAGEDARWALCRAGVARGEAESAATALAGADTQQGAGP